LRSCLKRGIMECGNHSCRAQAWLAHSIFHHARSLLSAAFDPALADSDGLANSLSTPASHHSNPVHLVNPVKTFS
ncbi:MAG: hypothetical protein MI924_13880, partial [Chloroflexales bacterium]|nr:hypothetical protein [Chloroflexales bacterium]